MNFKLSTVNGFLDVFGRVGYASFIYEDLELICRANYEKGWVKVFFKVKNELLFVSFDKKINPFRLEFYISCYKKYLKKKKKLDKLIFYVEKTKKENLLSSDKFEKSLNNLFRNFLGGQKIFINGLFYEEGFLDLLFVGGFMKKKKEKKLVKFLCLI